MKKIMAVLLSALILVSLSGCGAPSQEKIKAALDDGTITVEDAKAKGWIDDEWIAANFESVEAGTKIHLFDEFETNYLDGKPVSSKIISGRMCLVFFDTTEEATMEKLKVFEDNAEDMKKIGIPVLGIITDENPEAAKEKLSELPFPIIVYNEGMQGALEKYGEMLDTDVVSVFTKDGGFYSAWFTEIDSEEMLSFAEDLANEE